MTLPHGPPMAKGGEEMGRQIFFKIFNNFL